MDRYTLLYLKCITNNDLLYGIESSDSMLWGNLDGRGVWGRMDTRVCVWPSPFAVHLKLSQHCQLATFQYKIKKVDCPDSV